VALSGHPAFIPIAKARGPQPGYALGTLLSATTLSPLSPRGGVPATERGGGGGEVSLAPAVPIASLICRDFDASQATPE
jgi:hypothetical protein